MCYYFFKFILFCLYPFGRVKGNEVDLFDSTSYNNLESISEVLDRVCTCKRHSPTARTGDIECNYGTYQNCKFVVGKQYHCILNPEGQLRRKRDLRHLELMFSNAQTKNKPVRLNLILHIKITTIIKNTQIVKKIQMVTKSGIRQ